MYLRSDWFIQELRYLKFQVHIKMVKYIFKWGCVYYICNLFLFFFYLWIVIKDDKIFHILVHKIVYLNMTLEPFGLHDDFWAILVFWKCTYGSQLWLGFDQGLTGDGLHMAW